MIAPESYEISKKLPLKCYLKENDHVLKIKCKHLKKSAMYNLESENIIKGTYLKFPVFLSFDQEKEVTSTETLETIIAN